MQTHWPERHGSGEAKRVLLWGNIWRFILFIYLTSVKKGAHYLSLVVTFYG